MKRGTLFGVVFVLIALWSVGPSTLVGQEASFAPDEDLSEYIPPGVGKALVMTECTECHELDRVVPLRKSKQAWKALVDQMIAEGAELSDEKIESITSYLGEALGPSAPPLVDVNTAQREDLVKLLGVTPALADRLIGHRTGKGLFSSRDEVRSVLGIGEQDFNRIRWYLRARQASDLRGPAGGKDD